MRDLMDIASGKPLCEADELAWMQQQIDALGERRFDDLDIDTLTQFLTEMTRSYDRELRSRLRVLMAHILKIQVQPEMLSRSWINTISVQQQEIRELLQEIPSLKAKTAAAFSAAYPVAVKSASTESGIPAAQFPDEAPWSFDDVLAYGPPPAAR